MYSRVAKLFLGLLALSVVAWAADPVIGTWKLNLAKSKYSPGPPPKSVTLRYEPSGEGVKLTSEGVDAEGQPISIQFTANYDGKDVPYKGGGPLGADTIAIKRINASTTESTLKRGGKVVGTSRRVVSSDGKVLTITTTGTNAKGQKVKNVAVYDKQ